MNKTQKKRLQAIIELLEAQKGALDDLAMDCVNEDDHTEVERAGDAIQDGIDICAALVQP